MTKRHIGKRPLLRYHSNDTAAAVFFECDVSMPYGGGGGLFFYFLICVRMSARHYLGS